MNHMKKRLNSCLCLVAVILLMTLLNGCGAADAPNKLSAELQAHLDQGETEIQVSIWFEDIDLDAVKAQAEQTLGYTEDDIQKTEDAIPNFRSDINETDPDYERQFLEYTEQTRAQRAAVLEMMNNYTETLRRMEREAYEDYCEEMLDKLHIDADAVIYVSQYSPVVIATLSKKEILRLNKDPLVCALEYHDPNPPTTEAYEQTMFTPG